MKYFTLTILALAAIIALIGIAKNGYPWFIAASNSLSVVGLILAIRQLYYTNERNKRLSSPHIYLIVAFCSLAINHLHHNPALYLA